jgi:hypothetical protein
MVDSMRLFVEVDWEGDMSKDAYQPLVADIAWSVVQVDGLFAGKPWHVAKVGIQPSRVLAEREVNDKVHALARSARTTN